MRIAGHAGDDAPGRAYGTTPPDAGEKTVDPRGIASWAFSSCVGCWLKEWLVLNPGRLNLHYELLANRPLHYRQKLTTAFITHPDCLRHEMGADHPESPDRLRVIQDQLIAAGVYDWLQVYDAPLANREQLARAHAADYIRRIEALAPADGLVALDPDTAMNPHSWTAARRAAGAAVLAVDLVMTGAVENAFCSIRPPGHHAGHDRAMGFCIFNNIAVGAAHALAAHGVQRLAIADFDVHHGNGTEQIFRDNPAVLLCSTFQHPFYPFQGADSDNARCINAPLPAYSGSEVFRAAVRDRWLPALARFRPQLVLISAGFDAHREDDMAMLMLEDDDYVWVTEQIKEVAATFAEHRIVSVLEGGYHLDALGRCVVAHIKTLAC